MANIQILGHSKTIDCLDSEDAHLLVTFPELVGAFPAVQEHLRTCSICHTLLEKERQANPPPEPELEPRKKVALSHEFPCFDEHDVRNWIRFQRFIDPDENRAQHFAICELCRSKVHFDKHALLRAEHNYVDPQPPKAITISLQPLV